MAVYTQLRFIILKQWLQGCSDLYSLPELTLFLQNWWSRFWFWQEVVETIPLKPENFWILNPEIMHQTGLALQKYAQKPKKMLPTLGAGRVVAALQLYDEVSLAGFSYDLQHPQMPLHYYESLRTDAMRVQIVHERSAEMAFLKKLVRVKVITDLTGMLC
uniref:Uncharacterized protein n=1 Tax=Scleropages formosus TaxID=113540 RepID=A0A8C9V4R6_SCLFO